VKAALCNAALLLALTGCSHAPERFDKGPAQLSDNKQADPVSSYYHTLLADTSARQAELTLFLTRMPKGGDLHHHYSGSLYAETYIDWVGRGGYCVYRIDFPDTDGKKFKIETKADKLAKLNTYASEKKLKPEEKPCLNGIEIQNNNDFYRSLLTVWSDKDFHNHFHLQPPPDKQFFDTFGYFGDVSDYSYSEGLNILKTQAKLENVQYIETMLKSSPNLPAPAAIAQAFKNLPAQATHEQIDAVLAEFFSYLQANAAMQQSIKEFTQQLENLGNAVDDKDFQLRFQTYVSRNSSADKIFSGLFASFAADHASERIVGINFVSPENGVVAMRDYRLHMRMFHFLKQRFPASQISLHAGELTVGMVPPEGLSFHIDEAIHVAGAKRIGHGVAIPYETRATELLKDMREKNIAVEINLSSNAFILGVEKAAHPLPLYQRHRVPYVISTDDAGVSRSTLSHEYLLFVSRYKPSYAELKNTVYNSIRYSFLPSQEKEKQLNRLDQRFAEFEQQIIRQPN